MTEESGAFLFYFLFFGCGEAAMWIPDISRDPRWIVITCDRAKRGGTRGGKLPELLKRYGVRACYALL